MSLTSPRPGSSALAAVLLGASLCAAPNVSAQPPADAADADTDVGVDADTEVGADEDVDDVAVARTSMAPPRSESRETPGDAVSAVDEVSLLELQPRTSPDALRFLPGVSIQQSAHGQASAYVRGMTGQQVAHVFDGIRLNNGIYRQGPNQYFGTVDPRTVSSIAVVRGGSSVRHGSDAMGGAIVASPRAAPVGPYGAWGVAPRLVLRGATADRELGGRGELAFGYDERVRVLVGGGYRDAGLLRSGGVVDHVERPAACDDPGSSVFLNHGDCSPWTPRFAEEREAPDPRDRAAWRTQLGTGYREATADLRIEGRLERGRLRRARRGLDPLEYVAAAYVFEERDAPRTDQCPPQEAPLDECLLVARQARALAYGRIGASGPRGARWAATALYQRHVEQRVRSRPRSFVRLDFEDVVDTLGLVGTFDQEFEVSETTVTVRSGAELYGDLVGSRASQTLTDLDLTVAQSRGQYLEGSSYVQAATYADVGLYRRRLVLDGGARVGLARVRAPGDDESGTAAVARTLPYAVGRLAVGGRFGPHRLTFAADQSFRTPNLDDLTSRQQTGPGFQFENPGLTPERGATYELGTSVRPRVGGGDRLSIDLWAFATTVRDAIVRTPRDASGCPPMTPACLASRSQYQLQNASGRALLAGFEAATTFAPVPALTVRLTVSYVRGDAPDTVAPDTRVPLSKIPPLTGTAELRYRTPPRIGLVLASGLRWAAAQTRLAPADLADVRIPVGGTPGYAVWDVRVVYHHRLVDVSLQAENLLDAAYRVHGSSVNGPGRGLVATVSLDR